MPEPHPPTMKALVWRGPRIMTVDDVERPEVQPGDVRVRVEAVGICGSELSGFLGENALRVPPLIMGHEFSGIIDAVGTNVDGYATGERVVVNPLASCGRCGHCLAGAANLCPDRALVGAHRSGAFAEFVTVPATSCTRIPANLDFVQASLAEPVACAVRAVHLAGAVEGRTVRVIGAGPIGLFIALIARAEGASEVTVHDLNPARVTLARAWGFDAGASPPEPGAITIDAVGRPETRTQALAALERGGTTVFVGLHHPETTVDANDVVREEKVIRGSFAYTPDDFASAVAHLSRGSIPPHAHDWLSQRDLTAGPPSFTELIDTQPSVAKIVLLPYASPEGGAYGG